MVGTMVRIAVTKTAATWLFVNVDLGIHKTIAVWKEGVGADISIQMTNVLNHVVMGTPTMTLTTPNTFGRITGTANTPRNMEFGLRLHF